MRNARLWTTALLPVLGLSLIMLSGCGGSGGTGAKPVAGAGGEKPGKPGGKMQDLKVAGYAKSLKGQVTYSGTDLPKPEMVAVTKDQQACGDKVAGPGWYLNETNKGVRYALVFLRPPKGARMPKPGPEAEKLPTDKDGKEVANLEVGQPKCQFTPRAICLHPKQKVVFLNDSEPPIPHDSNLQGTKQSFQKSLPAGQKTEPLDPEPDDRSPYQLKCGIHQGFMSGYVWRPSHPYAVVTDADGNFELRDVPVLEGGKMILCVWHEMLPGDDHIIEIGEIDVKPGETATKNIAIPKKDGSSS